MTRVSIVIPVYNAEKYLDECIRSALDQTYADVEVVAVDDGSTDSSPEILDGYADRVRVFHKKNGGTASALNRAAREMSGDWFKWLSADDALKPHAVGTLIGGARSLGWPDDHIFYAKFDYINDRGGRAGRLLDIEPNYNRKSDFARNAVLLHHFYGNGNTTMFHRSIFERCGPFDESVKWGEDYEFWLRCCLLHGCRLHLVPRSIALSRVHESQLTSVHWDELEDNLDQIRAAILSQLPLTLRSRYVKAAARARRPPPPVSHKIRGAAHRALFACMPEQAARGAVRAYHKIMNDGL